MIAHVTLWIICGCCCLLAGALCLFTAAGVLPLLAGAFATVTVLAGGYAAAHAADRTQP